MIYTPLVIQYTKLVLMGCNHMKKYLLVPVLLTLAVFAYGISSISAYPIDQQTTYQQNDQYAAANQAIEQSNRDYWNKKYQEAEADYNRHQYIGSDSWVKSFNYTSMYD
jgi:hypothetical protein